MLHKCVIVNNSFEDQISKEREDRIYVGKENTLITFDSTDSCQRLDNSVEVISSLSQKDRSNRFITLKY